MQNSNELLFYYRKDGGDLQGRNEIMSKKSDKTDNNQNLQAHLNRLAEPFTSLWEMIFSQAEREELEMPLHEHEMPLRQFTADMKRDYTILLC